ncbi:MAG: hypothetical protein WA658_19560, partial [Candidatus Acidiferrales bacterium]
PATGRVSEGLEEIVRYGFHTRTITVRLWVVKHNFWMKGVTIKSHFLIGNRATTAIEPLQGSQQDRLPTGFVACGAQIFRETAFFAWLRGIGSWSSVLVGGQNRTQDFVRGGH